MIWSADELNEAGLGQRWWRLLSRRCQWSEPVFVAFLMSGCIGRLNELGRVVRWCGLSLDASSCANSPGASALTNEPCSVQLWSMQPSLRMFNAITAEESPAAHALNSEWTRTTEHIQTHAPLNTRGVNWTFCRDTIQHWFSYNTIFVKTCHDTIKMWLDSGV